jgi:hypothetical protein
MPANKQRIHDRQHPRLEKSGARLQTRLPERPYWFVWKCLLHFLCGAAVTRNWLQDVRGDISPCKSCNLFPVCGGGCPKQWYDGGVACPSYKYNIEDRLVLDYLINKQGLVEQREEEAMLASR